MSLKLSAGCQCCDAGGVCDIVCSDGSMQLFGYATSSVPFTLGGGTTVLDRRGAWWRSSPFVDGWIRGFLTGYSSPVADVPTGATGACVWSYFFADRNSVYCSWNDFTGEVNASLYFEGYSLCKFRISDTEYIWRLYVIYNWELTCAISAATPPVSDMDQLTSDWWWEYSQTTNNCSLDGSETWTLHAPSSFDLTVDCSSSFAMQTYPYTKNISDFCSSALSLTSVVDG